jgi:hypothetical protein
MKITTKIKSSLIILSAIMSTSLSSCGSQLNTMEPPVAQIQNDVLAKTEITLKSYEGLFEFVTAVQKAMFKARDLNKDGFVTKDEVKGLLLEDFDSIDLDHNGKINFKEGSKTFWFFDRDWQGGFMQTVLNTMFIDYIDKDDNMYLSRDEFLGFYLNDTTDAARIRYFKTSFAKNDINKDGQLNFSEYEDAMYQMFKRDIKVEINDNGYSIHFG